MTTDTSLRESHAAAVRERVLEGAAAVLEHGDELTFAKVAKAAGVPERTIYRYFPTRQALVSALFDWSNRRIGFDGELPADLAGTVALVRQVFPGFDTIAPVIHELLRSSEGLQARRARLDERQRAAIDIVRREAPGLDRKTSRRVAAVLQALTTAASWQTLRDYWGMDGKEAADSVATAIELLIAGARSAANRR